MKNLLAIMFLVFSGSAFAGQTYNPLVGGGGVAGSSGQVQYNNSGSAAGTSLLTVGTTYVTIGSNTQASSPVIAPISAVTTPGQATGLWGTFLTTAANYLAVGDSITAGIGASVPQNDFVNLISAESNATVNNLGISGEQACDMGQNEVFNQTPLDVNSNTFATMMVGTNEAQYKGAGSYEAVYKNCHQSALAWLAVPASYKVYGQSSACVQAGTWTTDNTIATGVAEQSTTNGSTLTCTISTFGGAVYVWYLQKDGNGGTFTYKVDSGSTTAVNGFTSPAIATQNGGTVGVGYIRLTSIAAGTHTVTIAVTSSTSASNIVSIYGVGTAPTLPYSSENTVIASGLIPELNLGNNAATLAYDADAQADALLLAGDGLPIRYAPMQPYFTAKCPGATSACMYNSFHPNDAGHELIHEAFAAVMQYPKSAIPTATIGGVKYITTNSTNVADTTNLNPGIVFYNGFGNPFGIDLGNNGTYYDTRIFTASSGGIAFGIQATNPTTQSSFTQWAAFKGGFLGIGIGSPQSPLSVNGGATLGTSYNATAAPANGLLVQGNVGIGTASPATTLDVNGSASLADDGSRVLIGSGASNIGILHASAGVNAGGDGRAIELDTYIDSPFLSIGEYQNYLLQTQSFQTTWVGTDIPAVTANSATSPVDTVTANNIGPGSAADGNIAQTFSDTSTGYWTFSVWLKSQGGTVTASLEIDSSAETGTPNVISVGPSWQRYAVTQNFSLVNTTKTVTIKVGTAGVAAWGAQAEPSQYARPYSGARTTTALPALSHTTQLQGALTLSGGALAIGGSFIGASTGAFSSTVTDTQALVTTPTNGYFATNVTAALVGTPVHISPSVAWGGTAWNTGGSASKTEAMAMYLLPISGSPTSTNLVIANQLVDGSANTNVLMTITSGGAVGIGTPTPSTGSILTLAGHPSYYQAAVPVVTSCGSGTAAAGSTDNKGQITGVTAATACTITFGSTMPTAPACSFSTSTGIAVGISAISTSAVTTSMAALTGTLYYICQ